VAHARPKTLLALTRLAKRQLAPTRLAARLLALAQLAKTLLVLAACLGAIAVIAALPAAATAATPCPNANATPQAGNLDAIRAAVFCLINQERELHGENPLASNAKLEGVAQTHSEDMAGQNYFSHITPSGETPLERIRASGYIYNSQLGYEVGENIAWGTLWLATPQAIVSAWMASPPHRANILDANYRETGIGVSPHPPASLAEGQAGALYTQDFGTLITAGSASRGPAGSSHAGGSIVRGPHRRGGAHASHGRRDASLHSHKHRSSTRSGRITSGTRTSERSSKDHGSTRRQGRDRHRVGARHRARHRRTSYRAGRAGAHQRSRRRHRHTGG
jgi:uncharacterized protein YkwD